MLISDAATLGRCTGISAIFQLAKTFTLLAQRLHRTFLQCLKVLIFQPQIFNGNLAHSLISLQLELTVVETDQLVTETVNIPAETSLAGHHIVIVVDILVQEGPVYQLRARVIN